MRTLDRMERDGLVERRQSPADRRAFLIYLTNKGKDSELEVLASANSLNKLMLTSFTEEEKLKFQEYLRRLIENLETS